MNANTRQQSIVIKPVHQRYVSIDENIFEALSIHTFSLYMVLRYQADYAKEDSEVIRSSEFLYNRAKIRRSQYFLSMNELEDHGLVMRDPESKLGEKCIIHVARELGYFKRGVSDRDRGVHTVDGGVHTVDTDHYSSSSINVNINTNSESAAAPLTKKQETMALMLAMIAVYREVFPDNPQPHPKLLATKLQKTLQGLIKRWPEADPEGKPLTVAAFRRYLTLLHDTAPKFSLGEYITDDGNRKKNSMETFCRWNTFVSFLENKYS